MKQKISTSFIELVKHSFWENVPVAKTTESYKKFQAMISVTYTFLQKKLIITIPDSQPRNLVCVLNLV